MSEDTAVGNDSYRTEDVLACLLQADELVRQPCYRIAFSASGRMLDQIAAAGPGLLRIRQSFRTTSADTCSTLAGLLFATMHGLIALEASGRMHPEKGLSGVQSGLETLVHLLSPQRT